METPHRATNVETIPSLPQQRLELPWLLLGVAPNRQLLLLHTQGARPWCTRKSPLLNQKIARTRYSLNLLLVSVTVQ